MLTHAHTHTPPPYFVTEVSNYTNSEDIKWRELMGKIARSLNHFLACAGSNNKLFFSFTKSIYITFYWDGGWPALRGRSCPCSWFTIQLWLHVKDPDLNAVALTETRKVPPPPVTHCNTPSGQTLTPTNIKRKQQDPRQFHREPLTLRAFTRLLQNTWQDPTFRGKNLQVQQKKNLRNRGNNYS